MEGHRAADGLDADASGDGTRLQLYAYLTSREHRRTYLEIMRLFTATLLADMSAGEVAGSLARAEREGRIDPGESLLENVLVRLKQLTAWGNLLQGRRETVAASIAEFQHGSMRYQVGKLAVRVQRDVDELLRVPEGAREVSRELLPAIERGLSDICVTLSRATAQHQRSPTTGSTQRSREVLAEQVTTLFLQHAQLADTVRDFYAYLSQVLSRHHLDSSEIAGFRNILVEYIQLVIEDVLRHTGPIRQRLAELIPAQPELLRLLGPAEQFGGGSVERARGRRAADWQELTDWFVDRADAPSQVTALRSATTRAIGTLLATVKRVTSAGGPQPGRRRELLHLATLFDRSTPDEADTLYANVFGLYSARNLLPAPENDRDDEQTPWRDGVLIDVPVSVRSRADRSARGRPSRIDDDPLAEEVLRAEARAASDRRAAEIAELASAGDSLESATLSEGALVALCGLLTTAMAQREEPTGTGTSIDPAYGLSVTLRHQSGSDTVIKTRTGTLTMHDTAVAVSSQSGSLR